MRKFFTPAIATVTLFALVASACSSSTKAASTSNTSQSGAPTLTDLKKQVAAMQEPPKLPFTVPLNAAPAKGKSLYFLEGSLLNEEPENGPFQDAANALGWKLKILQYDSTNPQAASGAMEEAAAAHADYIVIGGQTDTSVAQGLAATKAAKIPVIFEDTDAPATGLSGDGVAVVVENNQLGLVSMKTLINVAAVTYNGHANMLFMTDSEIPSLQPLTPILKTYAATACSTCTFQVQGLSAAQVATGNVGPQIVATLQSNPKINYVICLFTAVCAGLAPTLKTAGLAGKVKISVLAPDQTFSDELLNGEIDTAILFAYGETPWAITDAAARLSEGMTLDQSLYALLPLTVSTKSHNPPPAKGYYEGPPGFQQQFKSLWKV